MFHSGVSLQEGAILITDAHYGEAHREFYEFLLACKKEIIKAPQLIFLGDMFELLFGKIPHTLDMHSKEIDIINEIAQKMDLYYFEGNHDFLLDDVFHNVHVVPIERQPLVMEFGKQRIAFAHGDLKMPLKYTLYRKMIRKAPVLGFMGWLDTVLDHKITDKLIEVGRQRDQCYKIDDFENMIRNRLHLVEGIDVLIEGHFHQNVGFSFNRFTYINLGAFSCDKKYYKVVSKDEELFLEEKRFEVKS